jgi:hypothetical protein
MKNFYRLDFDSDFINKELIESKFIKTKFPSIEEINSKNIAAVGEDLSDYPDWPRHWVPDVPSFLTPAARKYLNDLGIVKGSESDCARIFQTRPLYGCAIHNDGEMQEDNKLQFYSTWSINYVWGDQNKSDMIWYEEIDKNRITKSEHKSVLGCYYQQYTKDNVKEIERVDFRHGLALVRIDIPHQVINYDSVNFRYCLSIRTGLLGDAPWEKAVEQFAPYLVDF